MSASKVILLTGASRGIGLAAAKFLLGEGHRLVVVARTAGPMEELKGGFPGKVAVVVGDAAEEEVSSLPYQLVTQHISRLLKVDQKESGTH
jgi:NAD(P)-dependent dehydrogenase (short-subunit alcohol dehydrogenase family)